MYFENMSFYGLESKLRKWKSIGALDSFNTNYVDSINLKSDSNISESASSAQDEFVPNTGTSQKYGISALNRQFQKLKEMLQQQQNKLGTMKDDLKISYGVRNDIIDLFEDSVKMLEEIDVAIRDIDCLDASSKPNNRAKCLLAAIESKQMQSVDMKMKNAVSKLPKIFEYDNLKERVSSNEAGIASLPKAPDDCFPEKSCPYRPIFVLTNWVHDLFTKTVTQTVDEHEGSALLLKAIKTPLLVDGARDKTQNAIDIDNFKLETNKLKKTCDKLPKLMTQQPNFNEDYYAESLPPSPPQPEDPEVSIIDHLMQSAVINKRIKEGQFNKAFEEALSSCNLALVMSACRAADPADVFEACCLSQAVLLSLVQQLATDMVHETQLKCRYLEEALINLDVTDQVTCKHLPVVVDEVRKHLSKFIRSYPYHVASRRIALIIMAADNLMK